MANQETFNVVFNSLIDILKTVTNDEDTLAYLHALVLKSKDNICREYICVTDHIKHNYSQTPKCNPLDRHKCAAAFMVAFLKGLKTCEKSETNQPSLFREKIAIWIGLTILGSFISDSNSDIYVFLKKMKGFRLPASLCSTSSYFHDLSLGLYYARKEGNLSVLLLANILFHIETYNRQLSEMAEI